MSNMINRRKMLKSTVLALTAATLLPGRKAKGQLSKPALQKGSFRYCLNSALLLDYKLTLIEQIELAAKTGYHAIEPWLRDILAYKESGGSLSDLKRRIIDLGLTVESAIAFSTWIVDDPQKRTQGIEQMKRDMDLVSRIGGLRIAAPPSGATNGQKLDLKAVAERYRVILEAGDSIGVIPQLELWGHSENLHSLGEALFVLAESGHPKACLLPDFFHIYKGGSDFAGLNLLSRQAIQVFHMNDYPGLPKDTIKDSDRIFPGDGIAPLPKLIRMMYDNGCIPVFSIELFNRSYWQHYDAPTIAKIGLEKMKAVTAAAIA
jgi:2-keto-myo-inositol isomerase